MSRPSRLPSSSRAVPECRIPWDKLVIGFIILAALVMFVLLVLQCAGVPIFTKAVQGNQGCVPTKNVFVNREDFFMYGAPGGGGAPGASGSAAVAMAATDPMPPAMRQILELTRKAEASGEATREAFAGGLASGVRPVQLAATAPTPDHVFDGTNKLEPAIGMLPALLPAAMRRSALLGPDSALVAPVINGGGPSAPLFLQGNDGDRDLLAELDPETAKQMDEALQVNLGPSWKDSEATTRAKRVEAAKFEAAMRSKLSYSPEDYHNAKLQPSFTHSAVLKYQQAMDAAMAAIVPNHSGRGPYQQRAGGDIFDYDKAPVLSSSVCKYGQCTPAQEYWVANTYHAGQAVKALPAST